ncbi:MAG: CaiB/BaiF CoA transferase family protein [Brevibacterium aurantiacum]|uniref:Formyl-CoA transferase n=1 Tax=Brevibacterium aurantiacum TaxID=273384 RepID=A0A2H1JT48_BREAU|nr:MULTISPECIES: CaiB/BaiF CoA-transferase family protein [Brevibacterium]RCS87528.1 CoA transferase [Brevibacterium aurantiacum]WCE40318.1 CaiB/BaiF CoA-transferase family protein [Brevibacterium sp. BDJS002]GEB23861.1 CoA transferase [Brevibacterium aurantiacum]SMX90232.1 formyl-CoA transferase [Brevibacterium aurantiacum]
MTARRLPLSGVRVLELGNYIAAPTTGRMLADFGAEVIKIERPESGDELRNWRLKQGTTSMLYRTINRNKKSVVLDLRSEEGKASALELVRRSDIVLENFRPGTIEKWGLGPEVLEEANPDIILVRISAFGQTGPMSERPGFAAVAEGYSGFRELVGDPDRPPVRVGISIGDSIAGMQAAFGAVMMLFDRQRQKIAGAAEAVVGSDHSFEGRSSLADRTVDVALNEAMFSVMESLVPDYSAFGETRTRTGGRMEGIAPSNGYLCAGGKSVVIAGNGDGIYKRLMDAVDRPDLGEDPDLQTNAGRWERREELDEAIGAWCAKRDVAEVVETLEAAGVPAGPIYTAEDLVADEQLAARGMIQHLDVSTGEEMLSDVAFPGITPVIGGSSIPIDHLGPDLGEHTDEVLEQLGGKLPERD